MKQKRILFRKLGIFLFAFTILTSCKKDVTSNSSSSTLGSNQSKLTSNGLAFASNNGIVSGSSSFSFNNQYDQAFGADFKQTGSLQMIFCYEPGSGKIAIYENTGTPTAPVFNPFYYSTNGMTDSWTGANYNLNDNRDRIMPFSLGGSYVNSIVCFRPGTGTIWIFTYDLVKRGWSKVFSSSTGLGPSGHNYNFTDNRDFIVPFDYSHLGYARDLICYRPGAGTFWVFQNIGTAAAPSYYPAIQRNGIGSSINNFDFNGSSDQIVPWDVVHDGQKEGLLLYRPGAGVIGTYSHPVATSTTFTNVGYSNTGIHSGNRPDLTYDLSSTTDRIIAYPPFGTGSTAALVMRPGGGAAYGYSLLDVNDDVIVADEKAHGIGTVPGFYFPLAHSLDRVFAFDWQRNGTVNSIFCYSPFYGTVNIFSGTYTYLY